MCLQAERSGCDVLSIPVPIRRGGSESNLDVVDSVGHEGVGLDFTKGALGIDSLQQKILKVGGNVTHLLHGLFADLLCLTCRAVCAHVVRGPSEQTLNHTGVEGNIKLSLVWW